MKRIHPDSCECDKEELNLFSLPPTQTTIEKSSVVEYHPISTIKHTSPLEFFVPGSQDYLDLSQTMLHVRGKVVRADDKDLEVGDLVGPTNLLLHSLFSRIDIMLEDKLITAGSANTYPYRAYLETLLAFGPAAKNSHLTASLFYKDTAGAMDDTNPLTAGTNDGLKQRHKYIKESTSVDMVGRLHYDLAHQDRLMLNNVGMRFKLVRAKDAFSLSSSGENPGFKFIIEDASIRIRHVKISPSTMLMHNQLIHKNTAKYPIQRVECKTFSIPANQSTGRIENLHLGQIPQKICIGLIEMESFHGDYKKNPFNFQNFGVTQLGLTLDGEQIPFKPLRVKYNETGGQNYIEAYQNLFLGTDKWFENEGNGITRVDYPNGYALYCFDLSPDQNGGDHFNMRRNGALNLEIIFEKALESALTVIVYTQFQNLVEVTASRDILFDYAA